AAVEQGQDVGVLQAGDDPDLAQEAIGAEGGADLRAEDLEGDLTLVAEVAGEVDPRHPALADQAEDLIAIAEGGPKSGEKVVHETAIAGSALLDRCEVPLGGPGVNLSRTGDLLLLVGHHFLPLRQPSGSPAQGEEDR